MFARTGAGRSQTKTQYASCMQQAVQEIEGASELRTKDNGIIMIGNLGAAQVRQYCATSVDTGRRCVKRIPRLLAPGATVTAAV